ncbi:MAG: hypothetical protein HYR89_08685 [Actinobacteria bacterium]|nr:hypothetical protein [Actinomycetota bacterium]
MSSKGDLAILVVLLAFVARERLAALGILAAGAGVVVRYGTGSLSALAGSQSVLGPAGLVGPPAQAVGAWLAAIALIAAGALLGGAPRPLPGDDLTVPRPARAPWIVAMAFGAAATAVVVGPSASRGLLLRLGATLPATLLIRRASPLLTSESGGRWPSRAVAVAGAASLVLVAISRSVT